MSEIKIKVAEEIIRRCLNDLGAIIRHIPEGRDGEKFEIKCSNGTKLFARVKKEEISQEMPYQEADVLKHIDSKHIIKPIIIDRVGGYYIIIRPFIEGMSLEERLQSGPLNLNEVRKLAITLIECVEALSVAGAVHFDIKPANIISGNDGNFYLIDFGTAKFLKKMRTERVYPARRCIAPEVLGYLFNPTALSFQQLSSLSDMYGVGAVLYSVITGHGISEILKSSKEILQQMPPSINYFKPNFDPKITQLVDSLLSKEPHRRMRPDDAKKLINGEDILIKSIPIFFLKTKSGRGSEHSGMLNPIIEGKDLTGIYWTPDNPPAFPKKVSNHNFIWETSVRSDIKKIEEDLSHQYRCGVLALCVPGSELENPIDANVLQKNLEIVDKAIEWRRKFAKHLSIFVVIAIDEALLISSDINSVKNAYASKNIDGIIIRICFPNKMFFDCRHLKAIKGFINPWTEKKRTVLFDGDLSVIPLILFGVSGFISSTYPKVNLLIKRRIIPPFSRKANSMYIGKFLAMVSYDSVMSLRGIDKTLVGCSCPACSSTIMKLTTNWAQGWGRSERRKHFIYTIPNELKLIKNSSPERLKERISQAQRSAKRFPYISLDLAHLKIWLDFLS